MDLETRKIGGVLKTYCVSIYDGVKTNSFFLTDFKSNEDMLEAAVKILMKRKYDGCSVYLHNFSNFDSVFLINTLQKLTDHILKPNRRNGKLINVQFKFREYTLYFRDSYLLLPSSSRKLAIAFKVENKGYFPHSFLNDESIGLDYVGKVPSLKHFFKFNIKMPYSKWKEAVRTINEFWSYIINLRIQIEILENNQLNIVSKMLLHQVISEFSKWIFKMYRVDIHKYPTLPSLAFAIFRSNFMTNVNIPIISGSMFDFFFHKGYTGGSTGGSVVVYKPFGKKVFRYDVNSLYPYVMK